MGRLRVIRSKIARPQTAAGLVAILFIAAGYMAVPKIVRPTTKAASAPVIQPIEQRVPDVQGAAVIAPVDCSKVPCMALTFDDGPNPEVTPQVLDILQRHNAKATFFLIGLHVPGNEALLRRMHQEGHEIGNHTWSHTDLTKLSPGGVEDEIMQTQTAIAAAGVPLPRLMRPPYGGTDAMVRSHIPLTVVLWNIDPEDWKAKKPEKIIEHVLSHARPGGVVDLHDIRGVTAEALDPILTGLEQSYHLVTVSQLLDLSPGQQGVFYGR